MIKGEAKFLRQELLKNILLCKHCSSHMRVSMSDPPPIRPILFKGIQAQTHGKRDTPELLDDKSELQTLRSPSNRTSRAWRRECEKSQLPGLPSSEILRRTGSMSCSSSPASDWAAGAGACAKDTQRLSATPGL